MFFKRKQKKTKIRDPSDLLIENEFGVVYQRYENLDFNQDLIDRYVAEYGIRTDVDPACIACQIGHIEKYKNSVDPGEPPWKIKCGFIPESYDPPPHVQNMLTKEEQELYVALHDPVAWAKRFLGVDARPVQRVSMRCTAKQRVLRFGRRAGKTWQAAMKILFLVMTEEIAAGKTSSGESITRGPRVMIVCPYLSQIENVFEIINNDLLPRNPDLMNTQIRYVRNPFHRMEFSNEGIIEGFTTGTKSKKGGVTLRGRGADYIYLDEQDYMDEEDYKAIMPILYEDKDRAIMTSSTPTGKRERFYKYCLESPNWKEFFFPASTSPNWEDVKEDVLMENSEAELMQEHMAEFIAQDVGVYQPQFVNQAKNNPPYTYRSYKRDLNHIYSMGIDWNTNAGTEICIAAMDRKGHIWLVETVNVTKQGWTQLAAMEEVVRLNRKWKPQFIYADRGYGDTVIELLQRFSVQAKREEPGSSDAQLGAKLVPYDFGSKVEVTDPATGKKVKKPAKDFLVQNSVRRFEEGTVHIPNDEKILYKQLLNYIVERITPAGVRKYGVNNAKVGDHRLDAFNLALLAYKLELSEFSRGRRIATGIRYAGKPGEHYQGFKKQEKALSPFTIDVRYPSGYMDYNIDSSAVNKNPRTGSLAKDKRQKAVYPGSTMYEHRPGFMTDTEGLYQNKVRKAKRRLTRDNTGRGAIRPTKRRGR